MTDLVDEMRRAAAEFRRIPCVARPIVTSPDALVSAERGCPEADCPICGGAPDDR